VSPSSLKLREKVSPFSLASKAVIDREKVSPFSTKAFIGGSSGVPRWKGHSRGSLRSIVHSPGREVFFANISEQFSFIQLLITEQKY